MDAALEPSAPVVLVGGWTIAAMRQPSGYSSIRCTISPLAAKGASDRWIMTSALAGLGRCHLSTAAGCGRRARSAGCCSVAGGRHGAVAALSLPAHGTSARHVAARSVAFVALAARPRCAVRRDTRAPLLAPAVGADASALLLALVAWFALARDGGPRRPARRPRWPSGSLERVASAHAWEGPPTHSIQGELRSAPRR